jgi:hypothetical protein
MKLTDAESRSLTEVLKENAGLAAKLAEVRSDRQREHELRVRYASVTETQADRIRAIAADKADLVRVLGVSDERIKALEAALRSIIARQSGHGTVVLNEHDFRGLRRLVGSAQETTGVKDA